MFSFLTPYMIWIKLATVGLLVIGACYAVHRYDTTVFSNYKQAQVILVQKSQLAAKQKEATQDATTSQAAEAYSTYTAGLESQLRRLRQRSANSSPVVRSPANSPTSPAVPSSELGGACEGTPFYANALRDAAQLNALIDTLTKLGIKGK